MKINLNQACLVRELPRGMDQFDRHYRSLGLVPAVYRVAARQPDGRLKIPLWQVATIYGDAMYMGPEPPIEMEIEVLPNSCNPQPDLLPALKNLLAEFDAYDAAMSEIGRGHEDYGGQRAAARAAILRAKKGR